MGTHHHIFSNCLSLTFSAISDKTTRPFFFSFLFFQTRGCTRHSQCLLCKSKTYWRLWYSKLFDSKMSCNSLCLEEKFLCQIGAVQRAVCGWKGILSPLRAPAHTGATGTAPWGLLWGAQHQAQPCVPQSSPRSSSKLTVGEEGRNPQRDRGFAESVPTFPPARDM